MSSILITGASGHLGKAVVNELLQKINAENISVLVRDPSKVQDLQSKGIKVIQGNYHDDDSLFRAFEGIDKLYFISSSEMPNRLAQHGNVVQAAVKAKVGHLVYTSAQRKSEDGSSPIAFVADVHWQTENLIKSSGLTYTILKHGLYSDVLPMFIGDQVMHNKTIFLPAGEGKTSFVSRNDLAIAGANVLTSDGHENKTYELGGPVAYSFGNIATMLSELSGETIQYVSPTAEAFSEQLTGYGVPQEKIQTAAGFSVAIAQGEFNFPSADLQAILSRAPEPVKDFLKAAYKL